MSTRSASNRSQRASTVLGVEDVLRSKAFAERLDVNDLRFDPEELARLWEETKDIPGEMDWGYDPMALRRALGPPVPLDQRKPMLDETVNLTPALTVA